MSWQSLYENMEFPTRLRSARVRALSPKVEQGKSFELGVGFSSRVKMGIYSYSYSLVCGLFAGGL
jgi:hypothetical protein